jgi:hypothetical protein
MVNLDFNFPPIFYFLLDYLNFLIRSTCLAHLILVVIFLRIQHTRYIAKLSPSVRPVPYLRRLFAGVLPRRPDFDIISVHVEFMVNKVVPGTHFLQQFRSSFVSIIPSKIYAYSVINNERCTRLFFFNGSTAPWGPRPPHFSRLHDHTL